VKGFQIGLEDLRRLLALDTKLIERRGLLAQDLVIPAAWKKARSGAKKETPGASNVKSPAEHGP